MRIRTGAYSPAGEWQPLTIQSQHRLLVIETSHYLAPETLVSHTSAAVLYGIPTLNHDLGDRVHVTRAREAGGYHSRHLIYHTSRRPPEARLVDGIPCTTPARTIVDLARHFGFRQGLMALDHCLRLGIVTVHDVAAEVAIAERTPRHWRAALVLDHGNPLAANAGESLARATLLYLGAPLPDLQPRVEVAGNTYYPDMVWWKESIFGEFDGIHKYGLTPGTPALALAQEKRREDALRTVFRAGFRMTWNDLFNVAPLEHEIRRIGLVPPQSMRDNRFI